MRTISTLLATLPLCHALRRVPVIPLAGKTRLPMERVSLLAMGQHQVDAMAAVEASEDRLFALQICDAARVGVIDGADAPAPAAGEIFVLCELLSTHRTRGYASQDTWSGDAAQAKAVNGITGTALALRRCKVERLVDAAQTGAGQAFATVEVSAYGDESLEASAGVIEFDKLLGLSDALDAVTDGVVHDALVTKAERDLWSYVLDCKRLVEQLGLVDTVDAGDRRRAERTNVQPKRRRSISTKFNNPGTWLQEDPFEVMAALAPKTRAAFKTDSREARAATRHQRRKVVLERSWRQPSVTGELRDEIAPKASADVVGRAELFSFAVAATLSSSELQGSSGLNSRAELLRSRNTLERLETSMNCIYKARSFLAARSSVANLFET